ncbi:Holliday junction resolvase RuvX [Candidatus Saccharibacteria bacterium HGW-Saccharibacteria-1]|jgi:putative Holliday junction resolvase|nr:MAG: Holliday junction resolvase RuvX [Candidatus Saccharibacteria bacterium HGW-Saccharibacteria-1]
MAKAISLVCLDVGEKRIGVAVGDNMIKIAVPFDTVEVDGSEVESIAEIYIRQRADVLVVGYPRNQSGEPTAQTEFVEDFVAKLSDISNNIVYQDESLTSVIAEQQLKGYGKPYSKADIDAQAAALILKDYLEMNYA